MIYDSKAACPPCPAPQQQALGQLGQRGGRGGGVTSGAHFGGGGRSFGFRPGFSRNVFISNPWGWNNWGWPYYNNVQYVVQQPTVPVCITYPNPLPGCNGQWTWSADGKSLCCSGSTY